MTFDVALNRLWPAKTVSVRQKPNPVNPVNPGNPAHDLHGHVYQDGHACQDDQVCLIGHLQVCLIVHLYTIFTILVSNAPTPEWLPQPRRCLKNLILLILEILQILLMIYTIHKILGEVSGYRASLVACQNGAGVTETSSC